MVDEAGPKDLRGSATESSREGRHSADDGAPLGIKLYAVVATLSAVYVAVLSFGLLVAGGLATVFGLLGLALTFAYMLVVNALLQLDPWGWRWGMIVFGLGVLVSAVQADLVGMALNILLLVYLIVKQPLYRETA